MVGRREGGREGGRDTPDIMTTHLPDIILRFMLLRAFPGAAPARAPGDTEAAGGWTAAAWTAGWPWPAGMAKGGVRQPSCPPRLDMSALK